MVRTDSESFDHVAGGPPTIANRHLRDPQSPPLGTPGHESVQAGDRSAKWPGRVSRRSGGVDIMDPVCIRPLAITAVDDNSIPLAGEPGGPLPTSTCQQRLTEKVLSKGAGDLMNGDIRQLPKLLRSTVGDKLNESILGKESSQLKIGPIHPPMHDEITGDNYPPIHSRPPAATSRTRTRIPIC